MSPRHVILANPETPRWRHYQRELADYYQAQGLTPEIELVPWREIVPQDGSLAGLPAFDRPALVRLESPGKDPVVARMLLAAGARARAAAGLHSPDVDSVDNDWAAIPVDKGRLIQPGLAYTGLVRVLQGLAVEFDARPHLAPNIDPRAAAEMFDKNQAAKRLIAAGVPMPERLDPPPANAAQLWPALAQTGWPAAFIKLAHGSSATGIVRVQLDGERAGVTTVVARRDGFYNTRRVQHVQGVPLEQIVQFILAQGASVEQAIRLAQIGGQNFDLRVIVIAGRPEFTIFRLSPHPMTNLHLGGQRGDAARCRREIPTRQWLDALDAATAAAQLYDANAVGVDVALERGSFRPFVLEVNAFGDFFPGFTDERGRSVAQVEIAAAIARGRGS